MTLPQLANVRLTQARFEGERGTLQSSYLTYEDTGSALAVHGVRLQGIHDIPSLEVEAANLLLPALLAG
jgi:hypothetical protein